MLGVKKIEDSHTKKNLAEIIMKLIENYGFLYKIGYFMMDNAANNNTIIDRISDVFNKYYNISN